MSLDQKLKTLRIAHHMTQADVAKRLNVARSTIAGYETKSRQPSHENLTALATLFNVSIDYLINDKDFIQFTPHHSSDIHPDEQALLKMYRSLSKRSKQELFSHGHLLELRDKDENIKK